MRCSALGLAFDAFKFLFFGVHVIPQINPAMPAMAVTKNIAKMHLAIKNIKFANS